MNSRLDGARGIIAGALARGGCLLVLTAAACFAPAIHAQSGGVMSRQQLEALLGESSTTLDNLRAARKQSVPLAIANREDRRGLTFKDDLRQNVLLPEVETRLEALEATIATDLRAGDLPGAQLSLVSLRRELAGEIERFKAITDYWKEKSSLKPDPRNPGWSARNDTLRASGIDPPPHAVEAATLETQFHGRIASREFAPAMNTIWPKLQEASQVAKSEEAQLILSRLDKSDLQGLPSAAPTRNCVPAKETSHAEFPAFRVKEFPSSAKYMSRAAKSGKEGVAEISVVVDSRGCPERAVLIGTSGNPALDTGALRMAVDGYYLPAEKDGAAMRSVYSFNFSLHIGH